MSTSIVSFWKGTQNEFEGIAGKNSDRIYFITDNTNIFLGDEPFTNKYKLPEEYEEFLKKSTYKKPNINQFSVNNLKTYEPGENIPTTFDISYKLSNTQNIIHAKLFINNEFITNLSVSNNIENISIDYIINNEIENTITFKLLITDTNNDDISSVKSLNIAFPMLYGSADNVLTNAYKVLNKAFKTSILGTYTIYNDVEKNYIWFCMPNNFSTSSLYITSGGFIVPVENIIEKTIINDYNISHTYYCIRTVSDISVGEYKISIENE